MDGGWGAEGLQELYTNNIRRDSHLKRESKARLRFLSPLTQMGYICKHGNGWICLVRFVEWGNIGREEEGHLGRLS